MSWMTKFAALQKQQTAQIIKDEPGTLLLRAPCEGKDAWWKLYRIPAHRQFLANFARSRAMRENRALRALHNRKIPAVHSLGWEEHRSWGRLQTSLLITQNKEGKDARALLSSSMAPEKRRLLLEAVARAARQLHDAGFGHFRMQLRNLLAHGEAPHCTWLDVPYLLQWPGSVPLRIRALDLIDLAGQDSILREEDAEILLLAYAGDEPPPLNLTQLRSCSHMPQKLRRIAYYLFGLASHRRP